MTRLRTRIGGLDLRNPVICGAGEHVMTASGIRAALATGVAGVVAKSFNESAAAAAQLDVADYALLRPDHALAPWGDAGTDASLLCRSGLSQTPPAEWIALLAELDREAAGRGQFVAASLIPADPAAAIGFAGQAGAAGLRVLELNIGSPQSLEAAPGSILLETDPARLGPLVRGVRAAFGGQLWVKLPGLGADLPSLAAAARAAGADAVGMTGRCMAMLPDPETLAPVLETSGGYGGGWALPITCRALALTRRHVGPDLTLIGTNGARSGLDVARLLLAGASAAALTSLVWQRGFAALAEVIDTLDAYLGRKHLTAAALVGRAAERMQTYQTRDPTPGRWRDFVPPEARS